MIDTYLTGLREGCIKYGKLCPALRYCARKAGEDTAVGKLVLEAVKKLTTGEGLTGSEPAREVMEGIAKELDRTGKNNRLKKITEAAIRMEEHGQYRDPEGNGLSHEKKDKTKRKVVKGAILAGVLCTVFIVGIGIMDRLKEERLRSAMNLALYATVDETFGEGKESMDSNDMMAIFLQEMLRSVDEDVDLTVRIRDMDRKHGMIEVEAVGEYDSILSTRHQVAVSRRIGIGNQESVRASSVSGSSSSSSD